MRRVDLSGLGQCTSVEEELVIHANIRVHHGRTQLWNMGGEEGGGGERRGVMPEGIWEPTQVAKRMKPDDVVERRCRVAPRPTRVEIFGVPIGQPECVRDFLEKKSKEQEVLFFLVLGINDPRQLVSSFGLCRSS